MKIKLNKDNIKMWNLFLYITGMFIILMIKYENIVADTLIKILGTTTIYISGIFKGSEQI